MEEKQQKRLCSVALLVISDGYFGNTGVAKSKSHQKARGILQLRGDVLFSKHRNNAGPFTAIPFPGRCQSNTISKGRGTQDIL